MATLRWFLKLGSLQILLEANLMPSGVQALLLGWGRHHGLCRSMESSASRSAAERLVATLCAPLGELPGFLTSHTTVLGMRLHERTRSTSYLKRVEILVSDYPL